MPPYMFSQHLKRYERHDSDATVHLWTMDITALKDLDNLHTQESNRFNVSLVDRDSIEREY